MVFSSFTFLLLFLPAVCLCTGLARSIRAKNGVLCLFSLVFYAWGEPVYVLLMLLSIGLNGLIGLGMGRYPARRKPLMMLSLALNLGALGYFKYADFLLDSLNGLLGLSLPLRHVALPIGISFYTFQILSYVIDVYRGRTEPQRDLLTLATYIAMFPQLVAGPIVRYETVREQLRERRVTAEDFAQGLRRCALGLGKKVLLANQMALAADAVFAPGQTPGALALWAGAVCYALQIYYDFSGYSDMAIGMGRMFGFTFEENFREPYLADSVTDFWRRWHISLSSWFREYVYIPLGGNRRGTARQIFNLMAVWLLTGLWHGAAWNFVLWGGYYGVLLVLEKHVLHRALERMPRALRRAGTLLLVLLGWILFRVETLDALGRVFAGLGSFGGSGAFFRAHGEALRALAVLPVAAAGCLPLGRRLKARWGSRPWYAWAGYAWALAVWGLSLAMLLGESYNPFIYFRF